MVCSRRSGEDERGKILTREKHLNLNSVDHLRCLREISNFFKVKVEIFGRMAYLRVPESNKYLKTTTKVKRNTLNVCVKRNKRYNSNKNAKA